MQKVQLQTETVRVEPHEALEQNYQLQNQLEEQIVKHQEQEKLNAELHLGLLEEKEKFTVREQENSMLEHRVEELSGEVERTRMLHLERVVTCVSGASKDKNAPQRFAGEDNSKIFTETQQEFKMDLPAHHEITDVTENAGNMWKSLQEYGNTEFDDAINATRGTRKSGVQGTRLEVRWQNLNTRRTSVRARLKKKVWSSAQSWLTCGVQPWDDMDITSTTCDDVDEKFDIDDENWDHNWNTVDVVADGTLSATVPERDKECDVTAGEQTRKKNMVDVGPYYASSAGGRVQTYLLVV